MQNSIPIKSLSIFMVLSLLALNLQFVFIQKAYAACASPGFIVTEVGDTNNTGSQDVKVIDIDEDGDDDFLVASDTDDEVYLYTNDGEASFTRTAITDGGINGVDSIFPINLDETGGIDVVAGSSTEGKIYWLSNDGSESFTEAELITHAGVVDIVAGNLNGAGGLDIAAVNFAGDDVTWWANDGSESFGAASNIDTDLEDSIDILLLDFDEDGDQDLVATGSGASSGGAYFYQNNGTGTFTTRTITTNPAFGPTAYDWDGMGGNELFYATGSTFAVAFANDGGYTAFTAFPQDVDPYNDTVAIVNGNINNDGDLDGYLADPDEGFVWALNEGMDSDDESYSVIYDGGSGHTDIATGDFNDDGDPDAIGILSGASKPILMLNSCDATAPTVDTLSPVDGATTVAADANLVITFDEVVDVESGNIVIYDSEDSAVETIDVTSDKVTGTGTTSITIDPATNLSAGEYYVQIASTAFDDPTGNSYAGISNTTSWNFTVVSSGGSSRDNTAPKLRSMTPANNADDVALDADLVLTFDETIYARGGEITVRNSDGSVHEQFNSFDDRLDGIFSSIVTIDLDEDFEAGADYYVEIARNAFSDFRGNQFPGLSGTSAWSFTTLSNETEEDTSNDAEDTSNQDIETSSDESSSVFSTQDIDACTDIEMDHWAYGIIEELLANSQYPTAEDDGVLCQPEEELSRGDFVKWMVSLFYSEELAEVTQDDLDALGFSDLDADDDYAPYLVVAKAESIVSGYPDGSFKIEQTINRAEILKVLIEALNIDTDVEVDAENEPTVRFADIENAADWFYPYLAYATQMGWIEGRTDSETGLRLAAMDDPILYSEAAKLLHLNL